MDMKINSELIVTIRKQRAWSQHQLSIVSGVSLRTIQRVENQGNASFETLKCIASAFETDVSSLIKEPAKGKTRGSPIVSGMAFIFTLFFCVSITSSTTAATGMEIQSNTVWKSQNKSETRFKGDVSVFIPNDMDIEISAIENDISPTNVPYQLQLISEGLNLSLRDARISRDNGGIKIVAKEVKTITMKPHISS